MDFLKGAAADQTGGGHLGEGPEGDPGPAAVPAGCGHGLPEPRAGLRDAFRRRVAAHPAGHPDRLRPLGGALRAGRAHDRASPARQRTPHRNACAPQRNGQYGARRRARRRHDDGLRRDHRHGAGRGPRGRRRRLPGDTRGDPGQARRRSRDATCRAGSASPYRRNGERSRGASSSWKAPRRTT